MRWYRAKKSSFKKANDIYIDGLDTGCDRRVYVLVMTTKLSQVHYATYDSHPENDWIPDVETVVRPLLSIFDSRTNHFKQTSHWPKPEVWTPSNFSDDKPEKNAVKPNSIHRPRPRRKMKVSKAPILNL